MQTANHNPVHLAIVGIGCLFPKADGLGAYWANIKHGVDCIGEVPATHWNPRDYFDADPKSPDMTYAQRGGFLSTIEFNPIEFGLPPKDIEATDTTQLLGLVAAKQALSDAGITFDATKSRITRDKVSIILGVTGTLELVIPLGARLGHPHWRRALKDAGVPDDVAQDVVDRISESYVPWQENSFPGLLGNVVAGRIANKLDLHGTNCVVDAACASSLSAVHMAAMELASGKADAVVTGGADTFNDIFMFMCFSKTPALSKSGDSKPFDANGDGTILGEGLGMVVLKRLADAERDGDTIYAVIRGLGTSSDGKGNAIYAPSAEGQKRCLNDAYRTAGVTPDTIELVEAHGTGTKVGDATEASALTEVYGQAQRERPWCAIGSVKSQIGHTKAAAGAASLIKAALALHFKVLPPTLKVSHPVDPLAAANSPFYVNTKMRPWLARAEHPRRAAVSAFGFGGSNFHAVLEEHTPTKTAVDWDGRVELYAICGETRPDILASLDRVPTVWTAFAIAAAESRTSFRNSAACRLILVAHRDQTDLAKLVESAKRELDANTLSEWWSTAEGAYYGRGSVPGKLGILFPGQGSQTVGMLRELSCLFPELLDTLDAANRARLAYDPSSGRISDRIYPPTSFTPGASEKQDAALRSTDVAQPAIGAVSFGAWRVLHERFNLTADAFAGHSFGELTALTAAGRLTPTELAQLAQLRGQLMAQQRAGDAGAMVAVFAPAHEIEPYLDEQSSRVVIANRNSPKQTVLSGSTADIEAIIPVLSAKKLRSARLPVAAAFHSPLVADAAKPFREALNAIPFPAGKFTVLANTTGNEYPADATATRNLLGEQLAKVVDFVAQIQTMARLGVRTFAEVGPGTVLSKLASQILEQTRSEVSVQAEFDCFALDGSGGKRSGVLDLAHFLARVAIHGYAVNLTAWEFQSRNRPKLSTAKPGLTIPLNGANYTQPRPKRPARSTPYPATVHAGTPTMNTTPGDSSHLNSVLTTTQQTLAALQRMQEETARLHKQFLESQAMAQQTLAALVAQQHAALVGGASLPRTATPAPAAAMVPVPVPTPQPTPVPASVPAPILPPTPIPPQAPAIAHTPPPASVPPASVPPASVPPASVPPASVPTIAATPLPVPTIPPPPTKERNGIHHVPAAPTLTPQPLPTGKSSLATTLLGVVSEKTGYPTEMLSLDMTLDGDLGIDSIKRVEILSALQEKLPGSAAVKPEQLGQLHTLRDVVTLLTGTTHEPIIPTMRFEGSKTKLLAPIEPQAKYEVDVPVGIPLETQFPTLPPRAPKFDVADTLLKVVSEKTGYPTEMLSLDMTLDGDLGIDSIKRVEILSALQEKLPGSAAVKPEQLGQLHTLRDVVTLLQDSGKGTEGPTGASSPQSSPTILKPRPVDFVPTSTSRVPIEAPAVREPLSTLNPKATDLVTKAGTLSVSDLVMPPSEQAVSTLTEPFKSVRPTMDSITDSAAMVPVSISTNGRGTDGPRTGGPAEVIERSILQVVDLDTLGRSPVALPEGGEIWLIGEDEPLAHSLKKQFSDLGYQTHLYGWSNLSAPRSGNTLAGLILLPPQKTPPTLAVNRLAMQWVQLAGPRLRNTVRPPVAAVIASITRLDGTFGLTNIHPTTDPVPGGIAGIIKTVRWEWPELAAKAIDIQPTFADSQAGPGAIVEEILAAGPIEVGISSTHRCRLEIARASRRSQTGSPMFVANDVVIVTGGARGVTAEVSVALAEAYRCTLILTGRTPVPTGPEPAYLNGLNDESAIKRAIVEQLGAQATPKTVADQYNRILAQREIRSTIARCEAAGGKAIYFAVNASIGRAVADLLHQVKVKYGPIAGIVHGAGVLADRRIEQLTPEQFDYVYSTKVDGIRHLLDLTSTEELKAIVMFSSITARQGRIGQLAYATANEVLNKVAQVEARKRPNTRVVSINWGPWDGGMVTVALRKLFESEGVGLIPLGEGGIFTVRELAATVRAVEVIALGPKPRPLSPMTTPSLGSSIRPGIVATPAPPMTGPPQPQELTLAFERTVDVNTHPVLRSHVLDGRAVLPMAIHMEWLAHAALHGNPGLVFHGFNDLRITHGVMVEENASNTLRLMTGRPTKNEANFHIPVEVRGKRRDGRDVVHSRAEVILTSSLPKSPTPERLPDIEPYPHPIADVYRYFLFHGAEMHAIETIAGLSDVGFVGTAYPSPPPHEWFSHPLRGAWVADPLVLDASFQMMILWSFAQHGAGSLPCFLGRYRQYRRAFPAGPTKVVIRITRDNGSFARADIDFVDSDGGVVAQVQDYECVIDPGLNQAFRRNQLGPMVRQ